MNSRNMIFCLALLAASITSATSIAMPAQILIIRHGEKINDVDPNLSERGRARAKALADFFTTNSEMIRFGSPVALYAAEPKGGSLRPIQTITPLAEKLSLPINHSYNKKSISAMVAEITRNSKYQGQTVVISWVHDSIPEIASQFGAVDAPTTWDSTVFDRVWVLQFGSSKTPKFKDVSQHLMPGDSK
jgi:hypothetical protein